MFEEEEEVYRVLDPDPPKRGANEVSNVDANSSSALEGNANFIQVVRKSGAVEERQLPKNPVKAKLIRQTEEIIKSNIEEIVSGNEGIANPEVGNDEKGSDESNRVTEESYASRAARTGGQKRNQNVKNVNNKLPGRPYTAFLHRGRTLVLVRFLKLWTMPRLERRIFCVCTESRAGRSKLHFVQRF